MKKIRLGVIGVGSHGTGHVRNIRNGMTPEIEVAAICDVDPEAIARVQKEFGDIPAFSDSHELIVSGLVDAVLIVTPHYFHPPISMDAMEHGLHVMCEKPAGVYTKQVKEMNAVAEKTGMVFGMMFNQRTNPVYIKTWNWYRAANSARSAGSAGSSPTGTVPRLTTIPVPGGPPGPAKAAVSC